MAEINDAQESECTFQWDEYSQLYYHAGTGFYHDPQAGWYYSSRDGHYYKFEDGNYVPLEGNQVEDQTETNNINYQMESIEAEMQEKKVSVDQPLDSSAFHGSDESEYPPPPSEWLEDTLIDMYLSGYQNQTAYTCASDATMPLESIEMDMQTASANEDEDVEELEEGEWIPDDPDFWKNLSEKGFDECMSQEEENWHAQYGQPNEPDEEWMLDLNVVDLWDWAMVRGTKKDGKTEVARLVGRLRKRSRKLHPAVPTGSGILKTATIRETHLDLVRVASGKVYRLRIPSLKYLASLPFYDASNPTKDWGFPPLSIKTNSKKLLKSEQQSNSQSVEEGLGSQKEKSLSVKVHSSKKDHAYRDRAAERRALHGGFGIGPGQKRPHSRDDNSPPSSPFTVQPEEAAAESMNMSFGAGSYARKIMEGMGWKEGEGLGDSVKGMKEPLQATGNKGTSGLGYNRLS